MPVAPLFFKVLHLSDRSILPLAVADKSVRPTHFYAPTLGSVALLVFLAGAAGAWVIAPDFFGAAHHLLHGFLLAAAGHAGLFEFAALLPLEGFFEIVDRSGDLSWRASVTAATGAK